MQARLIEIINQFDELDFCVPPDWWIEHFADHLLNNGVTIPPITCKHCTFLSLLKRSKILTEDAA